MIYKQFTLYLRRVLYAYVMNIDIKERYLKLLREKLKEMRRDWKYNYVLYPFPMVKEAEEFLYFI